MQAVELLQLGWLRGRPNAGAASLMSSWTRIPVGTTDCRHLPTGRRARTVESRQLGILPAPKPRGVLHGRDLYAWCGVGCAQEDGDGLSGNPRSHWAASRRHRGGPEIWHHDVRLARLVRLVGRGGDHACGDGKHRGVHASRHLAKRILEWEYGLEIERTRLLLRTEEQRHTASDDPVSSHEGTCPQGAGVSYGQAVLSASPASGGHRHV